ncbi:MAG: cadherin-like domain-containing protein, partial [Acidobacteriia bacterium]|nr:cadherin-like domain-containing protein [Terriglobia bacterium]
MRLGVFLFCSGLLLAQTDSAPQDKCRVEGRVVNSVTGEPVRRAKVTLRLNPAAPVMGVGGVGVPPPPGAAGSLGSLMSSQYSTTSSGPSSSGQAAANMGSTMPFMPMPSLSSGTPRPAPITAATDAEGDTLTWSVTSAAGHGTASASGTGNSKLIGYLPAHNYTGADHFTVQVSDGLLTDTIIVNVTVARPVLTLNSLAVSDGQILESAENSNIGGTLNTTATTFNLGDDAANRQYRAILSFNTGPLPDNAVITAVTLKIKQQGHLGANPFLTLGGIAVDIKKGNFG